LHYNEQKQNSTWVLSSNWALTNTQLFHNSEIVDFDHSKYLHVPIANMFDDVIMTSHFSRRHFVITNRYSAVSTVTLIKLSTHRTSLHRFNSTILVQRTQFIHNISTAGVYLFFLF